jgi:hypothetical protein
LKGTVKINKKKKKAYEDERGLDTNSTAIYNKEELLKDNITFKSSNDEVLTIRTGIKKIESLRRY